MFDLRARIGLMVPSLNTAMEPELNGMAPNGVSFYAARMRIKSTTEEHLLEMAKRAKAAAQDLADTDPDLLVYGCTSGSFVKGANWEEELIKDLEIISGTKVISTSGAIVKAIRALGKSRISIATPYIDEINDLAKGFFNEVGFNVVDIRGLGCFRKGEIRSISYQQVYRLAKSVITSETELLLLSCTEMRTAKILRQLEEDLLLPVLSSNQAVLWAALRSCGLKDCLSQYGMIFEV